MATVSVDVPAAAVTRVQDAFCTLYGYRATLPDGSANPQTKAQFTKQKVADFVFQTVKSYEAQRDAEAARIAAAAKVDTDISIT